MDVSRHPSVKFRKDSNSFPPSSPRSGGRQSVCPAPPPTTPVGWAETPVRRVWGCRGVGPIGTFVPTDVCGVPVGTDPSPRLPSVVALWTAGNTLSRVRPSPAPVSGQRPDSPPETKDPSSE